jgi:hypothetical protein
MGKESHARKPKIGRPAAPTALMTWELAAAFRGDRAAEARAVRVAFSRPPFAMRDARSRLQLVRLQVRQYAAESRPLIAAPRPS